MPPSAEILRALAIRGLLAADPAPEPLPGGNADRRADAARSAWRALAPDGTALKLAVGRNLSPAAERHRAAAEACPAIVPAPCFLERVDGFDVFAEVFVEGAPADAPVFDGLPDPARLRAALADVRSALASSERPSTAAARTNEWRRFASRLLAAGLFDEAECEALRDTVLPALLRRLSRERPVTRWSNGDFRTGNILVNTAGRGWLIDHEHGGRTHFFREDEVRFTVFTPEARHQPDLLPSAAAYDPAWHLYFWLRQFLLEAEHNTAAYLGRFASRRKALLRRLAEDLLGAELPRWSVPATPVDFALEDVRWLQHEDRVLFVSGWCHLPAGGAIEGFLLSHDDGAAPTRLLPSARPDVQRHFANAPATRVSGFSGRRGVDDPEVRFTLSAVTSEGCLLPLRTFAAGELPGRGPSTGHYAHWAPRHDPDPPPAADTVAGPEGPLFSILLPVYNTPPTFLEACLSSVSAQHYPDWEAVVVDDGSSSPEVAPLLDRLAADPRFVVERRPQNGGIARATNAALARARGDFVVLLDHDDVLRPHALASFVRALAAQPDTDVLYSDEDKIDEQGRRLFPFFKPDFSPEFLRGVMYPGHALCVRRALAVEAGGFDPAFDGVQDYEFFLRLSERTANIRHLPAVLYHWRRSPGSSALHGNIKGDMDARQLAAVQAHLERLGDPRVPEALGGHRIRLRADPDAPPVRLEKVILAPDADASSALLAAAETSDADVLVLAIDSAGAGSPDWERELAALALRPDSGCVAPVLLSDEERVLESGCTFAEGRLVPMMVNFDPDDDGYNGASLCNREVIAVSPLCLAVRRHVVLAHPPAPGAGWVVFTETLRTAGYRHRICAAARLSLPRSGADHAHTLPAPADVEDPYYNPAFRRSPADYAFTAPRRTAPETDAFRFHLDVAPPALLRDGCLVLRGWCFHDSAAPVRLEVRAGPIVWGTAATQPRPDVAAAFARPELAACGFALHLRLPVGNHDIVLIGRTDAGANETLFRSIVRVPVSAPWRRARRPDPETLLACQFPVAPLHAPRPLRPRPERAPESPPPAWPRFAVVTPSYGQASFLGETVRSVLAQPVAGDYVVQDGGSPDGSAALLATLAAGNRESPSRHDPSNTPAAIRPGLAFAWESAPDFGQTDALAKGFAKTAGRPEDVMAWLNADDLYLPGALAVVAAWFAKHPEVDVVYGHRLLIDEQSREIGRWRLPPHDPEVLRLYDFVPQETMFWRRRLWDRVGGVDPDFSFAMDWDLLLRFQASGARIVHLPRYLACFRVHAAQKTSAQLGAIGQEELDTLRHRTFGRTLTPPELIAHPRLQSYLRTAARLDLLATAGLA